MSKISLPNAFAERMKEQLGAAFADFQFALSSPSPISIRTNPAKNFAQLDTQSAISWCEQAYYLKERPSFTLDPLFHAGTYYVQEASSMFVHEILQQLALPDAPRVLDLCAAPGGKSTLLASALNKQGILVSNEVIRSRYHILRENMSKWGFSNTCTTNLDPAGFAPLKEWFDVMVIDAPCSGEGLFRKTPDATNEWSQNNVDLCAARQKRILGDILGSLADGGYIIYSTCTYNASENDNNVQWLIDEYDLDHISINIENYEGITATPLGLQFYPHLVDGEGFYVALLKKKGERKVNIKKKKQKHKKESSTLRKVDKKHLSIIQKWVNDDNLSFWLNPKDDIFAIPKHLEEAVQDLYAHLPYVDAGINIGTMMKQKFVPHHELAISHIIKEDIPAVEVDKEQALQFLRKESIDNLATTPTGWVLIRYKGVNLGWIKALSNRMNNYYPKEWKIRMKA